MFVSPDFPPAFPWHKVGQFSAAEISNSLNTSAVRTQTLSLLEKASLPPTTVTPGTDCGCNPDWYVRVREWMSKQASEHIWIENSTHPLSKYSLDVTSQCALLPHPAFHYDTQSRILFLCSSFITANSSTVPWWWAASRTWPMTQPLSTAQDLPLLFHNLSKFILV